MEEQKAETALQNENKEQNGSSLFKRQCDLPIENLERIAQPLPEGQTSQNLRETKTDPLRVFIAGLSKFVKEKDIAKAVAQISPPLALKAVNKPNKAAHAILVFENSDDASSFMDLVNSASGLKIKNSKTKAKLLEAGKGNEKFEREIGEVLKPKNHPTPALSPEELNKISISLDDLKMKICPLMDVPYEEQIEQKQKKLEEILVKMKTDILRKIPKNEAADASHAWIKSKEKMLCPLTSFVQCPPEFRNHYRNKVEFTIGLSNMKKGQIRVGFNVGDHKKGYMFVERADKLEDNLMLSPLTLCVADQVEEFLNQSGLPAFDRSKFSGTWRYLIVRHSDRTKEFMVNLIIKTNPEEDALLEESMRKLKEVVLPGLVSSPAASGYTLKAFRIQRYEDRGDCVPQSSKNSEDLVVRNGKTETQPVEEGFIIEDILGKKFQVHFPSFLQVNTPMADKLYSLVAEQLSIDSSTVVLDICSGIGTIGLCIGAQAKKIIAIECVEDACKASQINAQINDFSAEKYEVICDKVENIIAAVVKKHAGIGKRIVAIVDPPRAGLHNTVVRGLRTCKGLDELVYIPCSIESITENLQDFCLPESKKHKAPPFSPISSWGMDLFPHTSHFETMVYLKRLYE